MVYTVPGNARKCSKCKVTGYNRWVGLGEVEQDTPLKIMPYRRVVGGTWRTFEWRADGPVEVTKK